MTRQYSLLLVLPLLIVFVVLFMNSERDAGQSVVTDEINAVIGDESYIHRFGERPDKYVSDDLRIHIHLEYVESILRNRPTDHLTEQQRLNREVKLNLLREYYLGGEFPYNDGHSDDRRPTFISSNGNICAVGYLIEKTSGRDLAEEINEEYKYAYIPEIDDPRFDIWVDSSGFTQKELAMIQPAYDHMRSEETRTKNKISLRYGAASTILTGVNATYLVNSVNEPWLVESSTANHWLGLAAGAGSILLGSLNLDNSETYKDVRYYEDGFTGGHAVTYDVREVNYARGALSAVNIGVGIVSMAKAGYQLIRGIDSEESSRTVGVTQLDPGTVSFSKPVPAVQFNMRF